MRQRKQNSQDTRYRMPTVISQEALNKSALARRRLCGMGYEKGDDANGTKGKAMYSLCLPNEDCDPAAG